jgi:hypothetical protein
MDLLSEPKMSRSNFLLNFKVKSIPMPKRLPLDRQIFHSAVSC